MNLMVPIFWIRIFWLKFNLRFFIFHWVLRVKSAFDSFNPQQGFSSFQVYLLNKFAKISSVYFCRENSRPGSLSLWVVSTGWHLWIVSFLKGNFSSLFSWWRYIYSVALLTFQEILAVSQWCRSQKPSENPIPN